MAASAWLGSVPGWLTLLVLVAGGLLAFRGSLGPALGYYREANTGLEKENRSLKVTIAAERKENAVLRAKTDLEPLQQAMIQALVEHEQRAGERHLAILNVLNMIALRLGPDPGH